MTKLILTSIGDLKVKGLYIVGSSIFSLNKYGDLTHNGIEGSISSTNPNLLLSIGVGGAGAKGTVGKIGFGPENPNIAIIDSVLALDGGATIVENTAEYIKVHAEWAGTGAIFLTNGLEKNKNYRLTSQIEIVSYTDAGNVLIGAYNSNKVGYVGTSIGVSDNTIGKKMSIISNFNTNTMDSEDEIKIRMLSNNANNIVFIIYKDSISLTEI